MAGNNTILNKDIQCIFFNFNEAGHQKYLEARFTRTKRRFPILKMIA